jgi:hypothetical protein
MQPNGGANFKLIFGSIGATIVAAGFSVPAFAADEKAQADKDDQPAGFYGEVSASGTYTKRARTLLDDADGSNLRLRTELGFEGGNAMTKFRLEAHVGVSDYHDDGGSARPRLGALVELSQKFADSYTFAASAAHDENIVTLESTNTDQTIIKASIAAEPGNNLIEAHAGYRWRDYQDAIGGKGKGVELGARLRHRFGSYHWAAIGVTHDRIASNNVQRDYRRTAFGADYSVPVAKRLRITASADYRTWTYPSRTVGSVATAPKRSDRLIRPEIGLSYGRSKGLYARSSLGYDFYKSNDPRFSGNGIRVGGTVGYRF